MASTASRNGFKGFGYQKWVYLNFVFKMDLFNEINHIDAEVDMTNSVITKFDDIILDDVNNNRYYVQVKDYENFNIDKVSVQDKKVKIRGYDDIPFDDNDINIVVFQSDFECDDEILGMKAKLIDSIYFIPLTVENSKHQIGIYSDIYRKESIENLISNRLHNGKFEFHKKELPPYNVYPIKLNKKTVLLKRIPDEENIKKGIHWCIGSPGIGKSHLVCEFEEKYDDLIIYRFHIANDDVFKDDRLVFSNFLRNLGYQLFNNASLYYEDEIIKKLEEIDKVFIIDGLDHVENYREDQFDKFINFIEHLGNVKTLIFSRPLSNYVEFKNKYIIRNWFKEETYYFLNQEYGDLSEEFDEIYRLSEGYPIITFYLSEFVKNGGDLSAEYSDPINSITNYYDKITEKLRFKKLLRIFLTVPSYILENEIKTLLDEDSSEILLEYISTYPYLFIKDMNRISLFHDSFYTYLRTDMGANDEILEIIKGNILSKNIEYLSRFHTIDFQDDTFIKEVLKCFSNFETFKELSNNFDFESVKIFYLNLRKILKHYPNTLNIYQYYSLILIYMIVNRNDYFGEFSLFYQIFRYADWKGYNENDIYSNGVMWSLYKYYDAFDLNSFIKLLDDKYFDEKRLIDELERNWEIEELFYSGYEYEQLNEINIENIIRDEFNYKLLQDYLAYIWINKVVTSKYHKFIKRYVEGSFNWKYELDFKQLLDDLKISVVSPRDILHESKLKIYQCGYLEHENIYLKTSLSKQLQKNLKMESYFSYIDILSFLRLYNILGIDFDYSVIFKYFNMYSFRKDYSVETMDKALLIFEKHDLIEEEESLNLILNTMSKSEKGIRHLSLDYCAEKSQETIEKFNNKYDLDFDSEINYLDVEKINKFPKNIVFKNFFQFNKGTDVDFKRINNIVQSKYQKTLIMHLKFLKLKVFNVPFGLEHIFKDNDIEYELDKKEEDEYEFFDMDKTIIERGYLKKDDYEQIKLEEISYLDLAKLPNGNYDCLTYPDFFKIYDDELIENDLLLIIHNAITANITFSSKFLLNLHYCLGNILYLLEIYEVDVDWGKLFSIFKSFIEESGILFITN